MAEKTNVAKIYKMNSTNGKVYIGCTFQKYLSSRLRQHRSKANTCRDCTSRELFEPNEDGTEPVVSIELLEEMVVTNRSQAQSLERKYIQCTEWVNKKVTGSSVLESHTDYNHANKAKRKAWRQNNIEKRRAYDRMWRIRKGQKIEAKIETLKCDGEDLTNCIIDDNEVETLTIHHDEACDDVENDIIQ